MQLTIIRHSISTANHGDVISGGGLDVPLSTAGIALAQKAAAAFDFQQFDQVYASPMLRAAQTASILTGGRQTLTFDPRLVEMDFGQWEGDSAQDYMEKYPDAFDYLHIFNENYVKYDPGAESYAALVARCASFMQDLERKAPDAKVLVVCHGMTIRGLFAAMFHTDASYFGNVRNVTLNQVHLDENNSPRLLNFDRPLV